MDTSDAKQARNFDAERQSAEIRIRAERRAGELLKEMLQTGQRQGQSQPTKLTSRNTTLNPPPKLSDLGITRDQSSMWQQLAEVPEEDFERAVTGSGGKPNTEGIINAFLNKDNPPPKMDPDALWLWARTREIEKLMDKRPLPELLDLMTDGMREHVESFIPRTIGWLKCESERPLEEVRSGHPGAAA